MKTSKIELIKWKKKSCQKIRLCGWKAKKHWLQSTCSTFYNQPKPKKKLELIQKFSKEVQFFNWEAF